MTYVGGKNGAGVYQAIINQMPPHRLYAEPFCGSGGVLRRKRPAAINIALDLDPRCADFFADCEGVEFINRCGLDWLQHHQFRRDDMVYLDPPYLRGARSTTRDLYEHEMGDIDHLFLLDTIKRLPCMVMISGYRAELYERELSDWRLVTFTGQTRGGPREECLWCNFDAPAALHDPRYLGSDYRQRERIRKKASRWAANFAALDPLERQAVITRMLNATPPDTAIQDSGR